MSASSLDFVEIGQMLSSIDLNPVQAALQGPNLPLLYEFVSDKNAVHYADRVGFEGYALQFSDETKGIVELEAIDKWGAELASMLYTYRSIARALPTVGGDEAQKRAMYASSFEVLDPVMEGIKQLILFKERVVAKWTTNLGLLIRAEARLCASNSDGAAIPCEALYVQLLSTLDTLALIDALKDTKACLNNDFSVYKRAFQHCRADLPDAQQKDAENTLLQQMLPSRMVMLTALRASVQKLGGYDTVVADMATLAIEHLENEWYLLPTEKHRLLRSAAHALWLLDSPDKGGVNAFHHQRIKRDRFVKWLRRYPIVPLYGDMFANLPSVLERCPNFGTISPTELIARTGREAGARASQYSVTAQLPPLRAQAVDLQSEITQLLRRIDALGGAERCEASLKSRHAHTELALELLELTMCGCRLMSGVAALLHEVLAYKCAHVATDAEMHERARGAEWCDYERALRYNLDGAEKSALVELVATLKDLERCLGHVCGSNERLLCRGVHELTQRFIHQTMGAPTRKAVKYEKRALKTVLMQLRNLSADAGIAKEDIDRLLDEEVIKSKWFKHSENLGYPARAVPPSQTQLWLMRATARALYDERSPHIKGGMMHEAPLSKEIIKEMSAFVSASACFPYLLRLSSTLQELGDVSVLWMREFFLELSQRVQFPISMSLPSILCNHVLANGNSHLLPRLLYTFEAYSDGARRALQTHRQQHLLVEIEAETNLVFDQVLYALAEQLLGHFKTRAALALLPREREAAYTLVGSDAEVRAAVGKCWFEPLLRVRHARILGRSVPLHRLLTQRVNSLVRQSLALALERFESKSLDIGVVELHCTLRVARRTHAYLSELMPDLDSYEAMWMEASESIAFLSFSGRVLSHALAESFTDLLPNFAFRLDAASFQRPLPTPFTQQPERFNAPRVLGPHLAFGTRQLNAEYAMHAARASGSFGAAHAGALVAVLGEAGTQRLLGKLAEHVEELLVHEVRNLVAEVQEGLPDGLGKLPSYQYGAHGCYLFFEAKLKDIANYDELHSSVFHSFRRLGNAFFLLQLLESAVLSTASAALQQMPPAGQPHPMVVAATAVAAARDQLPEDSDMVLMSEQVPSLSAPLSSTSSIFDRALIRATKALVPYKDLWLAGETPGLDLGRTDTTRAFHRVWSVLCFLYASQSYDEKPLPGSSDRESAPSRENAPSRAPSRAPWRISSDNETLFGDGILFAGTWLLHALSQCNRYELLDFSSHVLAVYDADQSRSSDPTLATTLSNFVQRVLVMRRAHERFTAMLEAQGAPTVYNVWRRL